MQGLWEDTSPCRRLKPSECEMQKLCTSLRPYWHIPLRVLVTKTWLCMFAKWATCNIMQSILNTCQWVLFGTMLGSHPLHMALCLGPLCNDIGRTSKIIIKHPPRLYKFHRFCIVVDDHVLQLTWPPEAKIWNASEISSFEIKFMAHPQPNIWADPV
jgi:hypothetical protein